MGDFNAKLYSHERSPLGKASSNFLDWAVEESMIDLEFIGPLFTWNHGRSLAQRRSTRLDRAMCDEAWRCIFPEAVLLHCAHAYSDHAHILLKTRRTGGVRLGDRPFRFNAAWLTHGRFKEFVNIQGKFC